MPKNHHSKTLRDMLHEAGKSPPRHTDFIPAVFAGEGPFERILFSDKEQAFAVTPPSEGTGTFHVPFGFTPRMLATRAIAYGTLLAGREKYVPYGLEHMGLDPSWPQRIRRTVGTSLMVDAGVQEVAERSHVSSPAETVYAWAIEALLAMGSPQEKMVFEGAKKFLRARKYKKQAAMLKPLLKEVVEAAKRKENLVPHIRLLQDLYGTTNEPMPLLAESEWDEPVIPPDPPKAPPPPPPPPSACELAEFRWGKMGTITADMPNTAVQSGKKSKAWKRAAVGAFRYPWRALKTSDLQCFAIKRRTYGGTLLFDFSGSMHLSLEQIQTVLECSPEATMAAYGSRPNNTDSGRLVIMAKDGKTADHDVVRSLIGKGNVVDGPALEWLGTMPEPRIWVSDGGATGVDDETAPHIGTVVIPEMKKRLKIHQIPSAAELIRLLKS